MGRPLPLPLVGGGREDPTTTTGSSRVLGCWLRGLGGLVGLLGGFGGFRAGVGVFGVVVVLVMCAGGVGGWFWTRSFHCPPSTGRGGSSHVTLANIARNSSLLRRCFRARSGRPCLLQHAPTTWSLPKVWTQ